ncbi:hypothetical protein P885DRAFT_72776 [Corynascus similis CBS 632.67]
MTLVYADHPFPLIQTPPDMFDRLATDMAHVFRTQRYYPRTQLNLPQAPHIKQEDEKSFCNYITAWYRFLDVHHSSEEASFFPVVEKMTGVQGLMDANIEQHKTFHDGIERLQNYIEAVSADKEKYDGDKVVGMIDEFGEVVMQHLTDEIHTILGLRQYGDKVAGLPKLFDEEGEKAMGKLGNFVVVNVFANLDVQYENGMWQDWPKAPAPVQLLMRTVFWWIYADARKFGAVDRAGNLRHLYAVPKSA